MIPEIPTPIFIDGQKKREMTAIQRKKGWILMKKRRKEWHILTILRCHEIKV